MSAVPVRAAIYLRISLDLTGEQLAIARQREDCKAIAAQRGWLVTGEYVDNSISASDKRKDRPGYNRLVEDYQAGQFDALICWDLDRLTRQPRQLEDWIEAAEDGPCSSSPQTARLTSPLTAAACLRGSSAALPGESQSASQPGSAGRPCSAPGGVPDAAPEDAPEDAPERDNATVQEPAPVPPGDTPRHLQLVPPDTAGSNATRGATVTPPVALPPSLSRPGMPDAAVATPAAGPAVPAATRPANVPIERCDWCHWKQQQPRGRDGHCEQCGAHLGA